jgi:dTMP kinase
MKRGLFIVFEGLDGSGTSTQATLLRNRLLSEEQSAVLTSEPSDGPIGNMIRQAMKERIKFSSDTQAFDKQMAYLFAADRFDHLHNDIDGIIKLNSAGTHVSCTRYFFSSFAYHCNDDQSLDFVKNLNREFPQPDLVVFLKNSVERSIQRMANRSHKDVYENEKKLTLVSKNYDRIFSEYEGEKIILDAHEKVEVLHEKIYLKFQELL